MLSKNWEKYEDVTKQLLLDIKNFISLNKKIESHKKIKGNSGAEWTVDVLAYDLNTDKIVLVECKHRTNDKLNQFVLGGFAYQIKDINADRGIIVTTIGLQKGADIIAKYENISVIKLEIDITNNSKDYIARLSNQIFLKLTDKLTLGSFYSCSSSIKPSYIPPKQFFSND